MSANDLTKGITVVNAGTGQYNDMSISPATTANEILEAIGLPDYRLSKNGAAPFAGDANVFPQVHDGEKLYAAPPAVAGQR